MTTARKILVYGLYAIIVIGLGVAIVLALTHDSSNKLAKSKAPTSSQKTTKQTSDQPVNTPKQSKPEQTPADSNSSSSQAVANAARNAIGSSAAPATTDDSGQLVKTGPSTNLALFMIPAVVGGVAFHLRQLKKV